MQRENMRFSEKNIQPAALAVLKTLESAGFEAWLVGGCVRDLLLGLQPHDWDVTTNALPEEVMSVFPGHSIPTGLQHGTVSVRALGETIEVTTYRVDGAYFDHRHPSGVTFTRSLSEDLRRRDLTVNAIAMDARGKRFDPFEGERDLTAGVLRCVEDPVRRYREDALRIMRTLRFASRLGFEVEGRTAAAIHSEKELLGNIAAERIREEWFRLLSGAHFAPVMREYTDVFGVFCPEMLPMVGFRQNNPHHIYDVFEHCLHAAEAVRPPTAILRLTMLLHDVGKPLCYTEDAQGVGHFYSHAEKGAEMAANIAQRLKCSNEEIETLTNLVKNHDMLIPNTRKGLRRALSRFGSKRLRELIAVKRADDLAQNHAVHDYQSYFDEVERLLGELLEEEVCFSLKQLAVDGRDLLKAGIPQGPQVGEALAYLFNEVLEERVINEREALLTALKKSRYDLQKRP